MTTDTISSSQPTKGRRRNSSSASNTATETFANAAANFFLGADIADTTAIGGGTPAPRDTPELVAEKDPETPPPFNSGKNAKPGIKLPLSHQEAEMVTTQRPLIINKLEIPPELIESTADVQERLRLKRSPVPVKAALTAATSTDDGAEPTGVASGNAALLLPSHQTWTNHTANAPAQTRKANEQPPSPPPPPDPCGKHRSHASPHSNNQEPLFTLLDSPESSLSRADSAPNRSSSSGLTTCSSNNSIAHRPFLNKTSHISSSSSSLPHDAPLPQSTTDTYFFQDGNDDDSSDDGKTFASICIDDSVDDEDDDDDDDCSNLSSNSVTSILQSSDESSCPASRIIEHESLGAGLHSSPVAATTPVASNMVANAIPPQRKLSPSSSSSRYVMAGVVHRPKKTRSSPQLLNSPEIAETQSPPPLHPKTPRPQSDHACLPPLLPSTPISLDKNTSPQTPMKVASIEPMPTPATPGSDDRCNNDTRKTRRRRRKRKSHKKSTSADKPPRHPDLMQFPSDELVSASDEAPRTAAPASPTSISTEFTSKSKLSSASSTVTSNADETIILLGEDNDSNGKLDMATRFNEKEDQKPFSLIENGNVHQAEETEEGTLGDKLSSHNSNKYSSTLATSEGPEVASLEGKDNDRESNSCSSCSTAYGVSALNAAMNLAIGLPVQNNDTEIPELSSLKEEEHPSSSSSFSSSSSSSSQTRDKFKNNHYDYGDGDQTSRTYLSTFHDSYEEGSGSGHVEPLFDNMGSDQSPMEKSLLRTIISKISQIRVRETKNVSSGLHDKEEGQGEPLVGRFLIDEMARISSSDSEERGNSHNSDSCSFGEEMTRKIFYSLIFVGGILVLGSMLSLGMYLGQLWFCDQSTGNNSTVPHIPQEQVVPSARVPIVSPIQNSRALRIAVDAYLQNPSNQSTVAAQYGYPIGAWNVSLVTDFADLFSSARNPDAISFNDALNQWNVDRATNMEGMFFETALFNQHLSLWKTSKVTSMNNMFYEASVFNGDISTWDVSHVENMEGMFHNAESFRGDLSKWQLSNVINMNAMFAGAVLFNGDISSWDVSKVQQMNYMFQRTSVFNSNIATWKVSRTTTMQGMFQAARAFNRNLNLWDLSSCTDTSVMFHDASQFQGDISAWDVSKVRNLQFMFAKASAFNGDISSWNTAKATSMRDAFMDCSKFNADISKWRVSRVTDMSSMFKGASLFNSELSSWNVGSVKKMNSMFASASVFEADLAIWNVSCVNDFDYMFYQARKFDGMLSNWNLGSATTMRSMFRGASSFNGDLNSWDVSHVTDMGLMFSGAVGFQGDLGSWNVSSVLDMGSMFLRASKFASDLSRWDVSAVTNMDKMFQKAKSFQGTNFNSWDVSSVQNMNSMFNRAPLFNGNISQWAVARVTSMSKTFFYAIAFDSDLSAWDVSKVTDMFSMFYEASSFNQDLSGWDVRRSALASQMFFNAKSFNQNLCAWGGRLPPLSSVNKMFFRSGCPEQLTPSLQTDPPGPFCYSCFEITEGTPTFGLTAGIGR